MANSSSLTKKEAAQQQLQQQSQHAHDVETQEHHAKASASAGLNLNIFGALSGAFSSKSKKTTRQNADGSSEIVEDRHDQGMFLSKSSFHLFWFLSFVPEGGGYVGKVLKSWFLGIQMMGDMGRKYASL
ncbi:hypothetical protein BKA63DRAFT_519769 [Paraphoma chrysanthemicola]|nr:hypothetical protein BKA63DRAFT_519769 [Paraphoma chrysanthemicola]